MNQVKFSGSPKINPMSNDNFKEVFNRTIYLRLTINGMLWSLIGLITPMKMKLQELVTAFQRSTTDPGIRTRRQIET